MPSDFDVNVPVVYRCRYHSTILLYHDPCCLTRYSLAGQCVQLIRRIVVAVAVPSAERHIPYEGLTLAMGKQAGDYRRVGMECWDQLMRLYGGGPAIYVDGPPVEDLSRFVLVLCDIYPRFPVCFTLQEVILYAYTLVLLCLCCGGSVDVLWVRPSPWPVATD